MIYCIYLTRNPYEKAISYFGKELDYPGCHLEFIGYYETREEAVEKLNNGLSSEHTEFGKNGGFLVERNPGISFTQVNNRQFFKWDFDRHGFYEDTEPEIWKYCGI